MTAHSGTKQKISIFNQEGITKQIEQTLAYFRYLTRRYALFHTIFFVFFLSELIGLLLFLPFLAKSFFLASMVAAAFLTAFSYFVLKFYFQTKKPEQLLVLRDNFVQSCQQLLSMNTDMTESRRSFLQSIYLLIHRLEGQEYQYYQIPKTLDALAPLVQKFSVWCHFDDVHLMKELLHTYCLRAQLAWVKAYPTDLELHRSLASAYIALYKLYQLPAEPTYSFIAKEYSNPEMVQKFQKSAQCALEELKIVLHYVPHDTSALSNLANVYHDLDQKEEERRTYESLLELSPHEKNIRFQLGILYFQLGFMAHGLKIYDELRKLNDPKAEELIQQYDLFHSQNMNLFSNHAFAKPQA